MPIPTVVRIRRKGGEIVQDCDIYIGRRMTMGGWNLSESIWANPYKVKEEKDRKDVLEKYEEYIRSKPSLLAKLKTLDGKILGCWCHPKACHGDVLIKLYKEFCSYQLELPLL